MDSPHGQAAPGTRARLLQAAAELTAEVGWGRVTTRAVAERAGVPHGAVSYHFPGKQALLIEACVELVSSMFPEDALTTVGSVDALLGTVGDGLTAAGGPDGVGAAVLLEAMREASRDRELRRLLSEVLTRYRGGVAEVVSSDPAMAAHEAVPSDAMATLIVAAGDGLWLHSLLDPDLDVRGAVGALRTLVAERHEVPDTDGR